jgi:hypothetical protein
MPKERIAATAMRQAPFAADRFAFETGRAGCDAIMRCSPSNASAGRRLR